MMSEIHEFGNLIDWQNSSDFLPIRMGFYRFHDGFSLERVLHPTVTFCQITLAQPGGGDQIPTPDEHPQLNWIEQLTTDQQV